MIALTIVHIMVDGLYMFQNIMVYIDWAKSLRRKHKVMKEIFHE